MDGTSTADNWTDLSAGTAMEGNMSSPCADPWYPSVFTFGEKYGEVHGHVAAVVCVWGIVANIANIVVLTRKNMISSTNIILTWLAVADMLTMASYLPFSIHFYITRKPGLDFPETLSLNWIRFMLFHINFTVVCHTIAIWLTITLAIFRFLCICFPTRGGVLCSLEKAKQAVALVWVSTAIIAIPNYMSSKITEAPHQLEVWNDTADAFVPSGETAIKYNLGDTHPIVNEANFWIQAVFFKLLPCVLLTILTVLLILAMHRAYQRRMKLKSQGKKDESDRAREHNRTTAMLLAIVALFLITELPQGILTMCNIFIPCFYNYIYWPLGDTLDSMALLNNSVNFVLYCSMSSQFRNVFMETFCSICKRGKEPGWLKVKAVHIRTNGTHV